MLTDRYLNDDLADIIVSRDEYRPWPTASDREAWRALPDEVRQAQISAGEARLNYEWPSLPATTFMEFARTGNRRHYEIPSMARRGALADLVCAECTEGSGRFTDDIINGIWCICEESFWGVSAHNYLVRMPGAPLPDTADRSIDLFAGETGGLIAWTHYLLSAQLNAVHPVISDRMRRELKERIIDPYLERDDFGWMGLPVDGRPPRTVNNWNPWCHSNCLTVVCLIEDDDQRRLAAFTKALRSLDRFVAAYHDDGGCDEGTSYWGRAGASFFDCLELLHSATAGAIDLFADPLLANMGRYLYRLNISGDWFVNFADGGAKLRIAHDLVYRYGRRVGDGKLAALGSSTHHRRKAQGEAAPGDSTLMRRLPAVFGYGELDAATAQPAYVRDAWLDGIQVMTARETEGTDAGFFLAAKGGHNAESHNHNDVGQFIVYHNATPAIIDVGVETYTKKTFSGGRYDIWTMQSAYHNLPTVGGVQQAPGHKAAARDVACETDATHAALSLDIAPAYPEEAGIVSWRRTCSLVRAPEASVTVADTFELSQPAEVTLSLMTPREPCLNEQGSILLASEPDLVIAFPADALEAEIERIEVTDGRLQPVWGDHIFRILLRSRGKVSSGEWQLSIASQ